MTTGTSCPHSKPSITRWACPSSGNCRAIPQAKYTIHDYLLSPYIIAVSLYISRWRIGKRDGLRYLRVVEGLKDALVRRRVTQTRDAWRKEVLWMSLYFSVGVWVSLGIIFVMAAEYLSGYVRKWVQ